MKKYFIFPILWILSYASAQSFEWGKTFGGISDDVVRHMVVDDAGNSYTVGYFANTAIFGEGQNQASVTAEGLSDIFISKVNPEGELVWVKSYGALDNDYANGISLDDDGNIYVTGVFQQTVNFNPDGAGGVVTSNGFHDVFILKLDSAGDFIWVKSIGSPNYEEAASISPDNLGNVYVTGFFFSPIDFDPSDGEFVMNSSGTGNAFFMKLDADGNFQWAKQIGGADGSAYGKSVRTLENGNVVILGEFSGITDLNPDGEELIINSAGKDFYLLYLDASGNFLNVYHTSTSSIDAPGRTDVTRFDVDDSGNFYIIGSIFEAVNFDSVNNEEEFTITPDNSFYNGFVLKLNSAGEPQWVKQVEGSDMVFIYSVAVSNDERVHLTGFFTANATFGDFSITQQSDNLYDAFVAEIDTNGQFQSAYSFGGCSGPDGHEIDVDTEGNVYLSSSFHSTVDLNPFDGNQNVTILGEDGYRDIYTIKVKPGNLGITETELGGKIMIYPNPAVNYVQISGKENFADKAFHIYDITGKKVLIGKIDQNQKIALDNLTKGTYVLKIEGANAFKIIKK